LVYFAQLGVLLESFRPWQLKALGNITYYEQWKAYAAATGQPSTIDFIKELTRVSLELKPLVETYLGGVKIDITNPYQAGRVTSWSQRVFQLLHARNFNPATEKYEKNIDFPTAKAGIVEMLKAGPEVKRALEDTWKISIISLTDDYERAILDKWAGLIQYYIAEGIETQRAKATVLSIIREGKVEGINLQEAVGRLYTDLYGGKFDLTSYGTARDIYFGWATNIASILHQYKLFGNKEKDLQQAAQTTIEVMNNLIAEDKKLFKMVSDYLLRGEGDIDFAEGWMAGVGTYWGMIFTALKRKMGADKAYQAVQEELAIRKQIWDKVRAKTDMQTFQLIVTSMSIEEGGYWLSVMNNFERLLDYSKGKTSRDESLKKILGEIEKNLTYDKDTKKFTNLLWVITKINPSGKLPMSLDEYLAGGGPYMSLGQPVWAIVAILMTILAVLIYLAM